MRRALVVVTVVVAVVCAATLIVLRQREQERVRAERARERLLQFDDRQVSAVDLTVEGRHWRLERHQDGWRVVAPVSDVADEVALLELLSAMRRTPVVRVIDDPEPLPEYGLDPPVTRIELEGVDAPRLDLGNLAPTGDALFARVEGREGVLVLRYSIFIGAPLNRPDPDILRQRLLLGLQARDVVAVDVGAPAGEVGLRLRDDGWWLTRPRRLPAADEAVGALLSALEGAPVAEFHDDADPSDPALGLGPSGVRLEVGTEGVARVLVLGNPYGEGLRYARREDRDTVLGVPAEALAGLPLTARELASTRLSRVNRYRVVSFTYRRGGEVLSAARQGQAWVRDDGVELPDDGVYALLARVFEIPVSGWGDVAQGAVRPQAEIEYRLEDGGEGRIEFLTDRKARASVAPDVALTVDRAPPAVPRFP